MTQLDKERLLAELEGHLVSSPLIEELGKKALRSQDLALLYEANHLLDRIKEKAEIASRDLREPLRKLLVRERIQVYGAVSCKGSDYYHLMGGSSWTLCHKGGLWATRSIRRAMESPIRVGSFEVMEELCPQCVASEEVLKRGRPLWEPEFTQNAFLSALWARVIGYGIDETEELHLINPENNKSMCGLPWDKVSSDSFTTEFPKTSIYVCEKCKKDLSLEPILEASRDFS